MLQGLQVPLFDLVMGLSSAVDPISPAVTDHHKRVAYIAACLGEELGLPAVQSLPRKAKLLMSIALRPFWAQRQKEPCNQIAGSQSQTSESPFNPVPWTGLGESLPRSFEVCGAGSSVHCPWGGKVHPPGLASPWAYRITPNPSYNENGGPADLPLLELHEGVVGRLQWKSLHLGLDGDLSGIA